MAYAPIALALHDLAVPAAPARKSFVSRFLAALMETRLHQAEREIARYIDSCGGKFTDEAEREIERRFLSGPHW